MHKQRAIITLAIGSPYYYRMALALMISAHKSAGSRYKYFVFSDSSALTGLVVPEWLEIVKLSDRYFNKNGQPTARGDGFRIKSMILSDETILQYDTLFLDSDCYVFRNSFDAIFKIIEQHSISIYGAFAPEGQLWGKLNFVNVASKAGYSFRNMWLNSGFIGRAADPLGLRFAYFYQSLMKDYPFRPYITSKFWQVADEPYLAAAFQLCQLEKAGGLPQSVPSPSSNDYATTYSATVDHQQPSNPILHSTYLNGTFTPSIIHFLGGMSNTYYRKLVNETVQFKLEGQLMRPYFRIKSEWKKMQYYIRRLTDRDVNESRDF